MKIFINENLDSVLDEEGYNELLKSKEKSQDYACYKIDVEIGEEDTLNYITNRIYDNLRDISPDPFDNCSEKEFLENVSITYKLTDNWGINFIFDIIKENKEILRNSLIKIVEISLV